MAGYSKEVAIHQLESLECEGRRIFSEEIVSWLKDNGFFDAPASTKYHGNFAGGLFIHSYNVGLELQNLTDKLGLHWQRPISPWIIGIFHDLCKIDLYEFHPDNTAEFGYWTYRNEAIVKGHGIKSLVYALQLCDLTQEEQACIIYHMGAFVPESEWRDYTNAIHKFPNVLWTHTADVVASHIKEV